MAFFPPTCNLINLILTKSDKYYDLDTNALTTNICNKKTIFLSIMDNNKHLIVEDEDLIDPNSLITIKLVTLDLEYDKNEFFQGYISNLLTVLAKDDQYHSCKIIDIVVTDIELNIHFEIDSVGYTKTYVSESELLTDVLLYEFFKHVKEHDIEDKFEYSEMYGFRVRYSQLSVYEFIEQTFECIYGEFYSSIDLIELILKHCEPILPISRLVSENMKVGHECFLIFFKQYIRKDYEFIKTVLVSRIKNI